MHGGVFFWYLAFTVSSCFTASLFKPELSMHQSILSSAEKAFTNKTVMWFQSFVCQMTCWSHYKLIYKIWSKPILAWDPKNGWAPYPLGYSKVVMCVGLMTFTLAINKIHDAAKVFVWLSNRQSNEQYQAPKRFFNSGGLLKVLRKKLSLLSVCLTPACWMASSSTLINGVYKGWWCSK